jgi:tetratricopeptide (TPR) repeat protein
MFVYPRWSLPANSILVWLPLAGAVVAAVGLWRMRQHRWATAAAFGLGYFVIALLPVLGFFDIYYFRYSFVGDHFQYLASLGPIALLTAAMATIIQSRPAHLATTAVVAIALAALSWRHTQTFHDDATLWRDTLSRNPQAAIAHNNLGILLDLEAQYEPAVEQYREALAIKPDYLEAHANYGLVLITLKRYKQAEEELQEALRIKPDFSKAHYCLGLLYYHLARWDDAVYHYEAAIRAEPGMAEAYYDLGCVWQYQGQPARAATCFKNALLARPNYPQAYNNLGNVLAEEGQLQEAVEQYQFALQISPSFGQAHYNLGVKLAQLNHPDEAMDHLRQAIRLTPSFPDSYIQLAKLLGQQDRFRDAIAMLKSGLTMNSHNPVIGNEYAWLLATCPVTELHDAPQAIAIGEALAKATSRRDPHYLDTLAAAYADAGRFDEAVPVAREALSLAQSNNDATLATQLAARLALYEKGQPFRPDSP